MTRTPEKLFDWNAYGQKVLAGEIIVGNWTRLAVERHYRDLEKSPASGFYFSDAHAQYALKSLLFVKHSKGEFAGQQFVPEPWQQFWIAVAFGWLRVSDGTRRFRDVYEEVARKNGKTTKLSGIALYMLFMDGEPGAEVYAAATKMEQAKILFRETVQMIASSPLLKRRIKPLKDSIELIGNSASRLVPLGRDTKTMDGLNPHCNIIDEFHAHKTSDVYDILKSALGARRQPLTWMITTAGFDLSSYGYEMHRYAEKVLSGDIQDEEFLAIVYTVDDPEKWDDPVEWAKANPNLGVSVYEDNLRMDCERAKRQTSQQVNFKTKRLNIWLSSGETWIPIEAWRRCGNRKLKLEDFRGERCWVGLDLAEKSDVAALSLVFMRDRKLYVFFRLYLNEFEVSKPENQHYRRYRSEGDLIVTEGNATDFDVIREDLNRYKEMFRVAEVAYDPYLSSYFATKLTEDGLPMVEITQTTRHFTEPITQIENFVLTEELEHDGNRMMEWMMTNVVIRISKFSGLKQPTKETGREKIDGPVAMMLAVGRALADADGVVDIDAALGMSRVI